MPIDKFGRHICGSTHASIPHRQVTFPLTADGNYNIENRRLCNVAGAMEGGDCCNKSYVDNGLEDVLQKLNNQLTTPDTTISKIKTDTEQLTKVVGIHDRVVGALKKKIKEIDVMHSELSGNLEKIRQQYDKVEQQMQSITKIVDINTTSS
jgi:septal ring factor EnvC (AmiA/AmiB activator)